MDIFQAAKVQAKLFFERSRDLLKDKRVVWLGVILIGPMLLAMGYVGWQRWDEQSAAPTEVVLASTTSKSNDSAKNVSEIVNDSDDIMVDVQGEVRNPGVKKLRVGDRIVAAIEAAGGLSEVADAIYVAQVLNLAQVLEDGHKIYIPSRDLVASLMPTPVPLQSLADERIAVLSNTSSQLVVAPGSNEVGGTNDSKGVVKVRVNSASESELDALPGVGPATAAKIIAARPYMDAESLCAVINNSRTCSAISELIEID